MNIGFHIKKDKHDSIADAIRSSVEKFNITCGQIYLFGPRSLKQNDYDEEELKLAIQETKIDIAVHSSYFLSPWDLSKKQIKLVVRELVAAQNIGAKWLVIHLPASCDHSTIITAIKKIRKEIAKTIGTTSVMLLLEHKAHKPYDDDDEDPKSSTSAVGLAHLAGLITQSDEMKVGLCLDTAHIFVSNSYNTLEQKNKVEQYIAEMGQTAIDLVALIHYNGSYNKFGSGKDKHAIPFCEDDRIWSDEKAGAKSWVTKFGRQCPFIIECNRGSKKELKYAISETKSFIDQAA